MKSQVTSNAILDKLPKHLLQYVKPQNYGNYSAIDQAVWRYALKKNIHYLSTVAHETYLDGLKETGISTEQIPNMYGMNRILKNIGWAAVCVDGLIPTDAFLEFQSYNVLVITSEIRQLADIEYTPSPDIIHESAGHAPIIANPEYAEFLRRIGQIGCRAIASAKDNELYAAIKHLTILKEKTTSKVHEIAEAENYVQQLQDSITEPSEMAGIRNLHWWSVEYGLIGSLDKPKIYGAGLLSSIGESTWCMSDQVKKIPYSIETAFQNFDYTQPQPQLFVTPDFAHLSFVLEEFANKMSLRKGGLAGIKKLIESKHLGTIELSTGLQVSGIFDRVIFDSEQKVVYFQTVGKTALAYRDKELVGHGTKTHPHGFGSPIGKLKGINLAIEDMFPRDLEMYNIYEGRNTNLEFEGNITVSGEVITGKRNLQGKVVLISFKNCTVKQNENILFRPEWGIYDMAIGKEVVAAYAGAADSNSFDLLPYVSSNLPIISKSPEQKALEKLYLDVQKLAKNKKNKVTELSIIVQKLNKHFPNDWLLLLEIKKILDRETEKVLTKEIVHHLDKIKQQNTKIAHLIEDGLNYL